MDNPKINNIMVALAMNGDEQGMIQYAVHHAKLFNASLTVIHVQDPHAGGMSMMMDAPEKFEI
jgi:K+-sensing histidine kinase KdpD